MCKEYQLIIFSTNKMFASQSFDTSDNWQNWQKITHGKNFPQYDTGMYTCLQSQDACSTC